MMKSYNVCLKDTVKTFTKRLFYSLFDCEQEEEHGDYLKDTFLKILSSLEIENGTEIWESFKRELPEIRKKLDLDAIAFVFCGIFLLARNYALFFLIELMLFFVNDTPLLAASCGA